jgi:hypothetical protein
VAATSLLSKSWGPAVDLMSGSPTRSRAVHADRLLLAESLGGPSGPSPCRSQLDLLPDAGDVATGMGQRAHETAGDQITGQGHDMKRARQFLRVARRDITDTKHNFGSRLGQCCREAVTHHYVPAWLYVRSAGRRSWSQRR